MEDPTAYKNSLQPLLAAMDPISLHEMSSIRLMNRTDKKFVTDIGHLFQMLELLRDDYFVQEVEGVRICAYQTIYWDTPDHAFYRMHHNGKTPRRKIRVRTYLDSDITFLEVKEKNNHGRTHKERIMVAGEDRLLESGAENFLQEQFRCGLSAFQPSVCNHFYRITLVNKGKTERLTIDFGVCFENYETGCKEGTGNLVIIELKRDGNVPSPVLQVLRRLRVRPLGFSKYCIGSLLTNPSLKQNRFKMKMTEIRKRAILKL